jgi:uncharacterized RDD family membrane protein YckC
MVYEALLLFAILFFVILGVLLTHRHSPQATINRWVQISTFLAFGTYLVYFWTHGTNQTLPMKTWRIRLVMADGSPLRWQHAVIRYLLCWMWFLPAIVIGYGLHLKPQHALILLGVGMIPWALTVFLDRDQQFLHDRLAGTRLISLLTPPPQPPHPQ